MPSVPSVMSRSGAGAAGHGLGSSGLSGGGAGAMFGPKVIVAVVGPPALATWSPPMMP